MNMRDSLKDSAKLSYLPINRNSTLILKAKKLSLPLVYIQTNNKKGKKLAALKDAIAKTSEYHLQPDEEIKDLTLKENQIRYFNIEDEIIATRLAKSVGNALGKPLVLKDFSQTNLGSRVPLNQVEIWITE